MRRRGERGPLSLRALYTISELATIAGIHRNVMRRLVVHEGLGTLTHGTTLLVPLSELQDRLPDVWESLKRIERARYEARMVHGRAGAR